MDKGESAISLLSRLRVSSFRSGQAAQLIVSDLRIKETAVRKDAGGFCTDKWTENEIKSNGSKRIKPEPAYAGSGQHLFRDI